MGELPVVEDVTLLTTAVRMVQAIGYRFVTPTPLTHSRVNARPDSAWAQDLRGVFGWSRPFHEGVIPAPIFEAIRSAGVIRPYVDGGWISMIRLSTLNELLFAHSAYPTEAADSVFFGPDTYRFAHALGEVLHRPVQRAVDIGCGAGPAAILIAQAWPAAEVVALDINDAALRLTRANALLAGVNVRAAHSDLLSGVEGLFDLIVANPPYLVDPAARAYRHGGGPLGAGLSLAILDSALPRLARGGTLLLYTGAAIIAGVDPFLAEVRCRLQSEDLVWRYREIDPDVFGEELTGGAYTEAERIAAVVLTVRNNNNNS